MSSVRATHGWTDAAAAFYARGQQHSDYVERLGPAIRRGVGRPTSLIDLGAGTGDLGAAIIPQGARWLAVEPNGFMAERLRQRMQAHDLSEPVVITQPWEDLGEHNLPPAEVVLAANLPGMTEDPVTLWQVCTRLATRHVCWVCGAEIEPSLGCLSGFLPPVLRDPRRTYGYDFLLRHLRDIAPTPEIRFVTWTWRQVFPDFAAAYLHCAGLTADIADPAQQRRLEDHLRQHLVPGEHGLMAESPRQSAVCTWRQR